MRRPASRSALPGRGAAGNSRPDRQTSGTSGTITGRARQAPPTRWPGGPAPAAAGQSVIGGKTQVAQASIHAADPPGGIRPDGSGGAPDPARADGPDGQTAEPDSAGPAADQAGAVGVGTGPVERVMSTVIRRLAWSRLSNPRVALAVSGVGLLLGLLVGATAPNDETLPLRLPLSRSGER